MVAVDLQRDELPRGMELRRTGLLTISKTIPKHLGVILQYTLSTANSLLSLISHILS